MYDTRRYLHMNVGINTAEGVNKPNHCHVPIRLVKSAKNVPQSHMEF